MSVPSTATQAGLPVGKLSAYLDWVQMLTGAALILFMGLLGCEDVCPKEIPLQEQLGKLRRKMALAAVKNLLPKFLKKDF